MDNKFELVETILRSAGGEDYLKHFKEYGIDLSCLKLLNEEDLKHIGIEDEATRNKIIKNCSNLQMRLETRTSLDIDQKYTETVLNLISNQLYLHHANLAFIVLRNDITVCDVRLQKACASLTSSLQSLESEVILLQKKINPVKSKKRKKLIYITLTAAFLGFAFKAIFSK